MKGFAYSRGKRKTKRRPINVLASVLTSFGLYCGIASIFASIDGQFELAAKLILAAIVFDILDGTVAKMTHSTSEFGKQLDSLCDLVSFGVAPAVLIYTAFIRGGSTGESWPGRFGGMMAILFVLCGALRLARFNVYQSTQRGSFTGLPIPAAGGTVAALVLFTHHTAVPDIAPWLLVPLTLALAFLMVSSVRYPKDRLKMFVLAPRNAFRLLVVCVVAIPVIHIALTKSVSLVLLPLAATYVLLGIGDEVYTRVRKMGARHLKTEEASQQAQDESPSPANTGDSL